MLYFLALVATVTAIIVFLHWYSYRYLKSSIIGRRRWDLNICCGTTDGGGVNVDILRHADVPNFVRVDNVRATGQAVIRCQQRPGSDECTAGSAGVPR